MRVYWLAALAALPVTAAFAQQSSTGPAASSSDGHPDLSGYWGAGFQGLVGTDSPSNGRDHAFTLTLRNGDVSNLTNDSVIARRSSDNIPLYKPQYWDRVLNMDLNGNQQDPFNSCMPMGVPRMGPPRRIVQTGSELFFFYVVPFQRNDYRDIPIGARSKPLDADGSWMGDPIGHWEGDTLVVETEGFNDATWFGPQGYVHGYDMKVTEKFRREGDKLFYDSTVEDPEYLQKPWIRDTIVLNKIPDPNYRMDESPPCSDRDNRHLVGKQREM
jgi:hypothetical protein